MGPLPERGARAKNTVGDRCAREGAQCGPGSEATPYTRPMGPIGRGKGPLRPAKGARAPWSSPKTGVPRKQANFGHTRCNGSGGAARTHIKSVQRDYAIVGQSALSV